MLHDFSDQQNMLSKEEESGAVRKRSVQTRTSRRAQAARSAPRAARRSSAQRAEAAYRVHGEPLTFLRGRLATDSRPCRYRVRSSRQPENRLGGVSPRRPLPCRRERTVAYGVWVGRQRHHCERAVCAYVAPGVYRRPIPVDVCDKLLRRAWWLPGVHVQR